MPCRQVSTYEGKTGSGQSGGGGHATEADCLQACKEGACCEGTTCSVKPQCQCQCTSGSCCGPDTYTNITGETGPRCRTETQEQCAARGGVWRCGVSCRPLGYDPYAGYTTGSEICNSYDATPSATPVFKGVGTTCADGACKRCTDSGAPKTQATSRCHCFCGELGYPRFFNVSVATNYTVRRLVYSPSSLGGWSYFGAFEEKSKSFSANVVLSIAPQSSISQPWVPVTTNPQQFQTDCPKWSYGGASRSEYLPFGSSGAQGQLEISTVYLTQTSVQWVFTLTVYDVSEWTSAIDQTGKTGWATAPNTTTGPTPLLISALNPTPTQIQGPYTASPCFSAFTGGSYSSANMTTNAFLSGTEIAINGVQL